MKYPIILQEGATPEYEDYSCNERLKNSDFSSSTNIIHYLFENNKYLDKSDLSRQSARYNLYHLLTQYLIMGSL